MKIMDSVKGILPGLIVSFIIAQVAIFMNNYLKIGGPTLAILIGIILGNTFVKQPILSSGTKFSEKKLLEYSVVLLGFSVTFKTLLDLGFGSIIYIVLGVLITLSVGIFVGRKLNFSKKFSLMIASGNAICGSNAIAAVSGSIDADEEETGLAITIINLIGTFMMFIVPAITFYLFGNETFHTSAMIGGILQSVGQVVASASLVSKEVVDLSLVFKVIRILMLLVVVIIAQKVNNDGKDIESKKKVTLPWYVVSFFVISGICTLISVPSDMVVNIKSLSGMFEITALAAIGLRLNLELLFKQGGKLVIYLLIIGVIQILTSIIGITLFL